MSSSHTLLTELQHGKFDAYFAEPSFYCDNDCGVALFAAIKEGYNG